MSDDHKHKVFAVPPLARHADLTLNRAANAALIRHIEAGGVRALMYGGNANFYNIGLYEYAGVVDQLMELAAPGTWVIPSVGPDFGKMMDQAEVLRSRPLPTAMVLPASAAFSESGVESGLRRFADRLGKPFILYLRAEAYLSPAGIERLVKDKLVKAIKYGITREDPRRDDYLRELIQRVGAEMIISGMGERPRDRASRRVRPAELHLRGRLHRAAPLGGAVAGDAARRSQDRRAAACRLHAAGGLPRCL